MKTKIYISLLASFLFITSYSTGVYATNIYKYYIMGRIDLWELSLNKMEQQYKQNHDLLLLQEIVGTQYGYIAYLLSVKDNSKAEIILENALNHTERLLEQNPTDSKILALRGALMGFTIALNKLKAPFNGPKSLKLIDQSISLNPQNPYGYVERANALFYMPELMGGSKSKAIEVYLKAIDLFEKSSRTKNNWMYLNALMSLSNAYIAIGDSKNAKIILSKTMVLEPSFNWAKKRYEELHEN